MLGNRKDGIGMIYEGLQKSRVDEVFDFQRPEVIKKLDIRIRTMKNNVKGIEIMIKKGQKSGLSVKSTLDMCKNVDKIADFGLYDYYSKDLKGVSDTDTERLLDVWWQVISDLKKKRREIVGESVEENIDALSEDVMFLNEDFYSELDIIDEAKTVTFGGKTFPKFGWAVVMAGGAGSGKGHILKHRVTIQAKTIDPDEIKKLYVKTAKRNQEKGVGSIKDTRDYDFKNSEDVSALHAKVKQAGYKDKMESNFLSNVNPERLPNIIYDMTGDDASKFAKIGKMLKELGYKVAMIWVVTNRQVALLQNMCRDRVVGQDIFHQIHNDVKKTVFSFLKSANATYYDEAWVILNSAGSLKGLEGEKAKEFEKYSAIKLEKNGTSFEIPKDIEYRVYEILGPDEPNPQAPENYKNYGDIKDTMSKFAVKKVDANGKEKVWYQGFNGDEFLKNR